MIKIASQFSGIGAFEQAITNLGIEHENIMAVDFDKYARQTYTANFGEPKHYFVDSYNADYENVENVDVFLSSPPCQSFSLAGKRLGESDPRGLLFFETLRFINCNKPKYFIIENVKGLLSDNAGATFQNWIQLLGQSENGNTFMFPHEDSLMYNLHWQVLNTKDYGLPQNRERVFLVGIRNDLPNSFVFPKGIPLKLRLKDILEESVDEKYYLSEKTISYITKREGIYTDFNPEISRTICSQYSQSSNGSFIKSECKFGFYTCCNLDIMCSDCEDGSNYEMLEESEFIKVKSATASGYEIATEGDSINLEHPNSETRRGRVGKQVAQTLTTSCNQGIMVVGNYHKSGHEASRIVNEEGIYPTVKENHGTTPAVMIGAMRGRNPENPNDRSKGGNFQQTLEINENGTSNCLSTVQKDNLVVIHNIKQQVTVRKFEVNTILLKEILIDSKKEKGISIKDIAEKLNTEKTKVEHWFRRDNSFSIPDANIWFDLKKLLNINRNDFDKPITEFIIKDGVFEKADRVYDECGIAPTLTSTSADEKVLIHDIIQLNNPKHSNDRIYSDEGLSPTLNTMQGGNRQPFIKNNFRIRKLKVRECARLQGFPESFDLSKVSNSQGYKQMGNTISVNVIQAILKNLLT